METRYYIYLSPISCSDNPFPIGETLGYESRTIPVFLAQEISKTKGICVIIQQKRHSPDCSQFDGMVVHEECFSK